ncbi:MAG: hypothetical protein KAQ69_10410 [Spirochaetales bacterium]|nr:hypothetical protein [Spirochaetales bacterium]
MNSYERVMAALQLKEPDRVPVIEFIIDPHVVKGVCPEASDQHDFCDIMGLDSVCTRTQYDKVIDNDDGTYIDEWGVLYKTHELEVVSHPIKGPILTIDDVNNYEPPDPNAAHRLADLPQMVKRFKGRKAILFTQRASFMWSVYLNGMDNLLVNFLLEPELAHALLDKVLENSIQIIRSAIRAGADIIVESDDYASNRGPLMSPELFREFIFPRLKKFANAVHEEGGYLIKHTDGNIWKLLDMIIDAGVDAINPMEPVAGMDISKVKQKYGNKVCLVGNIDCGDLLCNGSVQDVEAAVRECIAMASYGGGHIICSSNSIHSSVRPENYAAMIKAAHTFGIYPV